QAPTLLAGSRCLLAGALRSGARSATAALRLHALRGGPAALHRRDLLPVRNADAPVQSRAALPSRARPRHAAGAGSADQSAYEKSPAHEAGTPLRHQATTLTELIESHRNIPRSITYLEGENDSRSVSFAE